MIVKFLGAAYLCWVGFKALRDAWRGVQAVADVSPAKRKRTLTKAYGEGFLTNALNPKVSIFYLAAFPQFIPAGDGAVSSAFMLICLHAVINAIWFAAMIILLARLTRFASGGRFQRVLKATTGAVFIAFGVKLAALRAS